MNTPLSRHDPPREARGGPERGTLEEALCEWCGRILTGSTTDGAPTTDTTIIRSFIDRHGITQVLAGISDDGPFPLLGFLPRPATKSAIAEDMAKTHELERVLAECERQLDRPPVIIKGQALAHTLYGQPWQRPRGDVDVMIEAAAVEELSRILVQLGYTRATSVEGDLVMTQVAFNRRATGVEHTWDVHWQISNRPALADAITYQALVDNAVEVPIGRTVFLAPEPVNALLIACAHLVGHHLGEPRMIWLYDIHLLVQTLSEADKQRFLERAARQPILQAACHAALNLTGKYLPADNVTALAQALDPGPGRRWRTQEHYLRRLLDDAHAVGRGRRLQLLRQHLFPSRAYMMRRFGIQRRWQLPFWYAIRFARAVPKLFRDR